MRCYTLIVVQEMFTALLMLSVSDLGKSDETGRIQAASGLPNQCDITIGDILGPRKEVSGSAGGDGAGKEAGGKDATQRDANFSLLSYSFNLVGPSSSLEFHPGRDSVAGRNPACWFAPGFELSHNPQISPHASESSVAPPAKLRDEPDAIGDGASL